MAGTRNRTDGDRIGGSFSQPIEHGVRPMPRCRQKGFALQHGFHVPFATCRHRLGKLDHGLKLHRLAETAIGFAKQHRIVPAGSVAKKRLQPQPQALDIADMAIVNCLLNPFE